MRTWTSGKRRLASLVTEIPSRSGMLRSRSRTSGLVLSSKSRASYPPVASPTSSIVGSALRRVRNPVRTMAWSSEIRTLVTAGYLHVDGRSLPRGAFQGEPPVQHLNTLTHAEQAEMILESRGGGNEPDSAVLNRGGAASRTQPQQ